MIPECVLLRQLDNTFFVLHICYDKEEEEEKEIWKPLKEADSKSPCTCGCIYIVSGTQRTTTITSSDQCYSLPIVWKIKVFFYLKPKM